MVAHRAQLRDQSAGIGDGTRTAANRGKKAAFRFLLGENDVLLALAKPVAAITIIATGKNIGFRSVGAGKLLINLKMIANDWSGLR